MSNPLDNEICKELATHIEMLTHSGLKQLDCKLMKRIKQICRLADSYVQQVYHMVLCQLEKRHSEIRLSAFQMCDELFRRSHLFRELLVSNMQHILELVAETNPDLPLPPPKPVAKKLKAMSLRSIHEWNKEFGDGYKKLRLGYNFLKNCKRVDFNLLEMENTAERARQQEIERKQQLINQENLRKVVQDISDTEGEIENTVTALNNCISLLLPSPDDFFVIEDIPITNQIDSDKVVYFESDSSKTLPKGFVENCEDSSSDTESEMSDLYFRTHGMFSGTHNIELNIDTGIKVKETSENAVIINNAKELSSLITKSFLPKIKKWSQVLSKLSDDTDQLMKILDVKKKLEEILEKFKRLNLNWEKCESEDSDSDFEEVKEKEGYEENVKSDTMREIDFFLGKQTITKDSSPSNPKGWRLISEENDEKDPTSMLSSLAKMENQEAINTITKISKEDNEKEHVMETVIDVQPSTSKQTSEKLSRKEKLLQVAPKIPFDVDLYHWEDQNIAAPTMFCVKSEGGRYWSSTSVDDLDDVPVPDGIASLRTRVIEFSGRHEPVKWTCRAPLPSGKLCPRKDRYKCPFHGVIVPRDEKGQCYNIEQPEKSEVKEDENPVQIPDWQDPELLKEIKEATGVDLKMPEKKRKGKTIKKKKEKNKFPGLTDIKAKENTGFSRLSKKVFKKSTMKRVASALDEKDHKRFRDKYGDQFHYMYGTS